MKFCEAAKNFLARPHPQTFHLCYGTSFPTLCFHARPSADPRPRSRAWTHRQLDFQAAGCGVCGDGDAGGCTRNGDGHAAFVPLTPEDPLQVLHSLLQQAACAMSMLSFTSFRLFFKGGDEGR